MANKRSMQLSGHSSSPWPKTHRIDSDLHKEHFVTISIITDKTDLQDTEQSTVA